MDETEHFRDKVIHHRSCVSLGWVAALADRPLVTPVAGMSQALPQTQFSLLRSMDWAGDASNHTRFDTHFVEVQSVGLNAIRWSGDFEERRQRAERQGRDDTPGVADRRVESHGGLLSPRQPTTDDGNHVLGSSHFRRPRVSLPPFEGRAIDRTARAVALEVHAARATAV